MIKDVRQFIQNNNFAIVGITGGAGSGKSYLARHLGFATFSIDSGFIGDSDFRKQLLQSKRQVSQQDYLDAINQYNWWNWDKIESDIRVMMRENYPLVVEGAFLGNPSILELFGAIIFIQTDDSVRFNRLVKRDGHKRTYNELMDRWQITGQSETAYYTMLFNVYPEKVYIVDVDYDFIS